MKKLLMLSLILLSSCAHGTIYQVHETVLISKGPYEGCLVEIIGLDKINGFSSDVMYQAYVIKCTHPNDSVGSWIRFNEKEIK